MLRKLSLVVAAATLVTGACGDDGPARDDTGSITDTGAASVFSFRTGDCFDDPAADQTQVEQLPAVPCSQPHDNEIFYTFDLPDGVFPGQDSIVSTSADHCLGDGFTAYVGTAYDDSVLDVFPVTPTESSWSGGDRTVYCAAFNTDFSKLTASIKGSGR